MTGDVCEGDSMRRRQSGNDDDQEERPAAGGGGLEPKILCTKNGPTTLAQRHNDHFGLEGGGYLPLLRYTAILILPGGEGALAHSTCTHLGQRK